MFNKIAMLYALAAKDIFKDKPYPEFIKSNPIFEKIETLDKIEKIFPKIGLSNFEEKVSKDQLDLSSVIPDFVSNLFLIIKNNIINFYRKINDSNEQFPHLNYLEGIENLYEILISNGSSYFYIFNNGAHELRLPVDIVNKSRNKKIFSKGQSLFKVYNDIKNSNIKNNLSSYNLPDLESQIQFKIFSAKNRKSSTKQDLYVVFSSEGEKGAWDICTISERGIQSCQSWTSEYFQKQQLAGSMLSKYVGVIYLTDKEDVKDRGERMMYRAIVRFIAQGKTPYIFVDKIYPAIPGAGKIQEVFENVLKKRTSIKVITDIEDLEPDLSPHIPKERIEIPEKYKSYQDSGLTYKNDYEKRKSYFFNVKDDISSTYSYNLQNGKLSKHNYSKKIDNIISNILETNFTNDVYTISNLKNQFYSLLQIHFRFYDITNEIDKSKKINDVLINVLKLRKELNQNFDKNYNSFLEHYKKATKEDEFNVEEFEKNLELKNEVKSELNEIFNKTFNIAMLRINSFKKIFNVNNQTQIIKEE